MDTFWGYRSQRVKEAYEDRATGLSRAVLTGEQKHSVIDAVITNIEGRTSLVLLQLIWTQSVEWKCLGLASSRVIVSFEQSGKARTSSLKHIRWCGMFFSMKRDVIGQNFTAKQVQYGFRKVALEFVKRLDPDLPFYYHSSSHTRYSEGPLHFNQASTKPKHKGRWVPRRELSGASSGRPATLPV